ncbi:MAG: hypothetical protein ACP5NZ_00085 [Nanobdellota archaeon]
MKSTIYNKLELVEKTSKRFLNITLEDTLLIACQHILKTNYQMFLSLFDRGLKPKNTFLLGKCYSTDKEALEWFIEKGVNVSKYSNKFDSYRSFDESFDSYVKVFLKKILKNIDFSKYKKVIILDDGGHLLKEANKLIKDTRKVIGIEQTSSGYEAIKNEKLRFSVINVARSFAKLEHESPIIADLFVENLNHELRKLNIIPKNVLIIGNGPIGREIFNKLSHRYNILRFDKDISKSNFNNKEELETNLHRFDMIIGCTGKISFPSEFYSRLNGKVILASASSSDREFTAVNFRMLGERYTDCHRNFSFRDITLLNSGFPMTFTDYGMGAEGKNIQLTRALIFSAILSSINTPNEKKLLELNLEIQKDIISDFYKLKGGKG